MVKPFIAYSYPLQSSKNSILFNSKKKSRPFQTSSEIALTSYKAIGTPAIVTWKVLDLM
jgi:hypothetical protein